MTEQKYIEKNQPIHASGLSKSTGSESKLHRRFLDMSQIYYSQKNYQKALECINKAVKKAPNQPICYGIRADIKKAMNDLIGSLMDYQQVLFLNPKDTQIWKHIAYVQNLLLDQIPEGSSYLRVHLKSGHKAMLTHINGQVVTFLELPRE